MEAGKMWRPPNWEKDNEWRYGEEHYQPYDFEAGADAMLEELIKKGDTYTVMNYGVTPTEHINGWIVFIPEENNGD
jgi:hypothetical protein